MGEFKRRPGQTLGLALDLRPNSSETLYVTAFLFDKDGAALVPASVNLTDLGGGQFVENSTSMQSVPQMRAKYRVFFDDARTDEDECEYLGGEDVFDIDELAPSQLPGEVTLTGDIQTQTTLTGELQDEKIEATIENQVLSGAIEDDEEIQGSKESQELTGEIDDQELEGNIN